MSFIFRVYCVAFLCVWLVYIHSHLNFLPKDHPHAASHPKPVLLGTVKDPANAGKMLTAEELKKVCVNTTTTVDSLIWTLN